MKRHLLACLFAATSLSGCMTLPAPEPEKPIENPFSHAEDKLLMEANALAEKVKSGELTRVQAADVLNTKRLGMTMPSPIDDEVFRTYRRLTVQLEQGKITQEKLRASLINKLESVRKGYLAAGVKPVNPPTFTNMLLKVYGRPPL